MGGKKKDRVAGGRWTEQRNRGDSSQARLSTTSVLFVEFSRGGSLQKRMKECLDKISPMLGFKVRVTEKGGTPLSSLLSNKDLWSGVECGRETCRTCAQPGERKEPCMQRNIVYESECSTCNPQGTRKEADKEGLAEKRDSPSLYVGETARSVAERAAEHWRDAESGREESHMLEHQVASHMGEGPPQFSFKVVKGCKTSLERQVREAVRIHMRGNVLNKKGLYNRCKLTRLVVDQEWEEKVWKESWSVADTVVEDEWVSQANKGKRKGDSSRPGKRLKREEDGVAWGESVSRKDENRDKFLYTPIVAGESSKLRQSKLAPISGVEWFCRQILRDVTSTVVEQAGLCEGVAEWEEWEAEGVESIRSSRYEKELWKILDELDKLEAKTTKAKKKKEAAKVAKARASMGVGSKQLGIKEIFARKSGQRGKVGPEIAGLAPVSVAQPAVDVIKPKTEGGSCVNTQTGSKSNNVIIPSLAPDSVSVAQPPDGDVSVRRLTPARGARVSVAELCGKFDDVWKNGCLKCSKLRSVRCVDCIKKIKYGDDNGGPSDVRTQFRKWSKPSYFTHTKGGNKWSQQFEVTTDVHNENKEGDIFQKNFAVQSSPTLRRDEQITKPEVRNTYFVGKEGHGKSNNLTPTKRKLIRSKQVSKLVPVFNNTSALPVYSPGVFGISESPAKKQKLEHQGSTTS